MQIWKSTNIRLNLKKKYVEDFGFEQFVYKHSETIEYAEN